jgi:hypothetical protein
MNLIITALATWQIVEIWHHSTLFAGRREAAQRLENKLGELLTCPWCLSVWVGFGCNIATTVVDASWLSTVARIIVYGFACSRLANLGNDVFKQFSRTPVFRIEE